MDWSTKHAGKIVAGLYVLSLAVVVYLLCTSKAFRGSQATQQPEPCICPTYEEIAANTARMEVYIDSSQSAHKKDRERFSDSVKKYKSILKIK